MSRGFTIIEAIIYMALLGLIMTGAVTTAYALLQGSASTSGKTVVQDESNFVLRKINWAFSGASGISVPNPQELVVTRYDGIPIVVSFTGSEVDMSENGGISFVPLTTSNIKVSDLVFTHIAPVGSGPEGVSVQLTVGSSTFSTTKYLRK